MTLIKSISGIRGTIGGKPGDNLTPVDVVAFASAYASSIKNQYPNDNITIVIGRDARPSGEMISQLVGQTLIGLGIDVIDLGLSTTPSVEMAVTHFKAKGGIILTASHNPIQWNALKLLNYKGEFISAEEGRKIIEAAAQSDFIFSEVTALGKISTHSGGFIAEHIDAILNLPYIQKKNIAESNIKVVIDPVNSSGAIAIPMLLEKLGIKNFTLINGEPNGLFAHNPEPLAEHLEEICKEVVKQKADLGIVVDPDVDRLAFISEDGTMFGEEYTLVAIADYLLPVLGGNTVSNLSSSRALADITMKHGFNYSAAAVGEVNVVAKMKETGAVIGGEGNGGVILPDLHYGRDALVGLALFLSYYVTQHKSMSEIKKNLPTYSMSKNKIELNEKINVDSLLDKMKSAYTDAKINTEDGVKIDLSNGWIHLRKSNTEPIIRIYTEGESQKIADHLAEDALGKIKSMI